VIAFTLETKKLDFSSQRLKNRPKPELSKSAFIKLEMLDKKLLFSENLFNHCRD